ncbi:MULTISPECIES: hypothetical protein [unclassified Saccharopolyspora]|uniref:hypothetical protein n=1 Tax=unclassified Saccharopolyspora TaxID=2646250 RepID=UPI001CD61121|nr:MULTISPECIES: hypothetical protein [unclassified Saccharopolyspora]MCA1192543.1 hypothetical protein [Saccharopolyspora sp. 6V]MCA1225322.1 hypothetical protein [Saccharopolyspora sp. 6M]
MPIRTHRGRAAVYRRLWGWPLRSPKHLVTAVIVLAAAATTIGIMLPEPPPSRNYRDPSGGTEQHQAVPAPASPTPAPPTISVPNTPPAPAPADPAGLHVVEAWGAKWATHPPGTPAGKWVESLRPYTTDEFITVMTSVDPANVPSTRITGPAVPLSSTANSIAARLPTDAGDIEVDVMRTEQGWRVSGYNKVS